MEKRNEIKRIAILGAESTGKTTLARSLALRYHTQWVPEYAREYMSMNDRTYDTTDIERIAKEQLEQEEQLIQVSRHFIFSDTEFIIAKIWCEDVFGKVPSFISEKILDHKYDLYLLTANDLPWIPDPVRVNAQRRDHFFNIYKKQLEDYHLPFEVVNGRYEARLFNAVNFIRKHFGEVD